MALVKADGRCDFSGVREKIYGRIPRALRSLEQNVIASCDPYVPYRRGNLSRSASPSGDDSHGEVRYTVPYASECYYSNYKFSKKKHPRACSHWFEAGKAETVHMWCVNAAAYIRGSV